MKLVIAATGPANYLLLIGHIDILPALFEKIILPTAVKDELSKPDSPLWSAVGSQLLLNG